MNSVAPNWTYLQSFVAVAEAGSLSAAARALALSQPTLSRHIANLEDDMGQRLFDRAPKGLVLTPEGASLLEATQPMADAAARAGGLFNGGGGPEVSGTVRITASHMVATFLLPALLTRINRALPKVALEVVGSDETSNLLRREADIALRMYRPTQNDVITRHLGELAIAAYATPDYVAAFGAPAAMADLHQHRIIGYDRSTLIIDAMTRLGMPVARDFFAFRSDDHVLCWQMVRAGFGIGFNQALIGDGDPGVMRLAEDVDMGTMPVWLTAHAEMRQVPRIRRVYDLLGAAMQALMRQAKE